jgi:TetR/AcrR family transcriptional regulator, transcriptional repressor for nem operon
MYMARSGAGGGKMRSRTKLTPKGLQTKQRIIEAATRLMDVHGAARTSLDDVREEAGVSSSQIYHYFSDKQSLMLAVIDRQHREGPGDPGSMRGNFGSLADVRAWAELLIDQQRQSGYRGCPIATLGSDPTTADPRVRMRIAASLHRFQDHMRAGYRSMQADGEISAAADPNALASMTLTSVIGGLVLTQLNRDTTPLSDILTALLQHIEDGAAPKTQCTL